MGSFFGEGASDWVDMGDAKFLCTGGNSKYFPSYVQKIGYHIGPSVQ